MAVTTAASAGAFDSPVQSRNKPRPRFDYDESYLLTQFKHQMLVSDCRAIEAESPLVRGGIAHKTDHCVGDAWSPKFSGTQSEFAGRALNRLDGWLSNPTGISTAFSWNKLVRVASRAMETDGDMLLVKRFEDGGEPYVEVIESHRIGTPGGGYLEDVVVPQGNKLAGFKCRSGVIRGPGGEFLGFNILPASSVFAQFSAPWNVVEASECEYIFEPSRISQVRGIPSIAAALTSLYFYEDILSAERTAQLANSSLTLIESNETGVIDPMEAARRAKMSGANKITEKDLEIRLFQEGMIKTIKNGNGLKAHEWTRPSQNWQSFMETVSRDAFIAMGWSSHLLTGMKGVGSAAVRAINAMVRASILNRQNTLYGPFLRIWQWRVAVAITRREIPFFGEWMNWDFAFPPRLSIDAGHDSKIQLSRLATGLTSLSEEAAIEGRDARRVIEERAADQKMVQDVAQKTGVDADKLFNPYATLSTGVATQETQDQQQAELDPAE